MENVYLKTKQKNTCNGCTACACACPKGAIEMVEDTEGFIYPSIIDKKCIKCGKCLRICSNYSIKDDRKYIAYAGVNESEDILSKSTSGGVFSALVDKLFLEKDSVCYGVAYNDELEVVHTKATTIGEASKFYGSKYVRSNILGVYKSIKNDLKEGKKVLFTGTPCQCHGLTVYLNKDYENLVICDIICHSNPSPKVFSKYIKALEQKEDSKICKYTFRSKTNGWNNPIPIVQFQNGKTVPESSFSTAFARVLISRPCCHDCKFVKPFNYADITIGDFWGVDKLTDIKDYQNGISLILANTKKGINFLNDIRGVKLYKLDDDIDVFKYNHKMPEKPHRNREKFFKKIDKYSDVEFLNYMNKMSQERLLRRLINKIRK